MDDPLAFQDYVLTGGLGPSLEVHAYVDLQDLVFASRQRKVVDLLFCGVAVQHQISRSQVTSRAS